MDEILVSLTNVSRHYDRSRNETAALSNISCQIAANDRVAVVGPSGSGKSTLLHLIAGLDKPTEGVISWPALGPAAELRPDQICLVLQTPSLLPTLSVLENVELCWLLSKMDERDAESAARRILKKLDLSPVADKLPAELSGGQIQRVAVARALVCQPRLIMADEPTGQLDSITASRLIEVLLDAANDSAAALIVATHDRAVANRMQTQWRIVHGRIE